MDNPHEIEKIDPGIWDNVDPDQLVDAVSESLLEYEEQVDAQVADLQGRIKNLKSLVKASRKIAAGTLKCRIGTINDGMKWAKIGQTDRDELMRERSMAMVIAYAANRQKPPPVQLSMDELFNLENDDDDDDDDPDFDEVEDEMDPAEGHA